MIFPGKKSTGLCRWLTALLRLVLHLLSRLELAEIYDFGYLEIIRVVELIANGPWI